MTTYAWPTGDAYRVASSTWTLQHSVRRSTSSLNGSVQTVSLPGARWAVSLEWPQQSAAHRAQLEARLLLLGGGEHRMTLHDVTRPVPLGTCNTTGVTASAAAQFASALTLNGCGASRTLLAGDWLGVTTSTGSQLVQVVLDATANASGVMAVEVRPMLRGSVAAASGVTLIRPTAVFMPASPSVAVPRGLYNTAPAFGVDLVEVFA